MLEKQIIMITGTSKGIGKHLADHYLETGNIVVGCSRSEGCIMHPDYVHFQLDITVESEVKAMFKEIRTRFGRLDVLINNAGIASMNHFILTPLATIERVLQTNVVGVYLFSREAAKIMKKNRKGDIINFSTVAVPLRLEGEAIYAASKAAVVSLTQVMSKELAEWGIKVNAIGPTPINTDLIKAVPREKIQALVNQQTIKRLGDFTDVSNVIDFFISKRSSFITGQILYLGGINQ